MVRFTGVHHLAFATGDMDATIRFWRDLLGMRLVVGLGRPGNRQYFFAVSERDFVAFFEWPGIEPVPYKRHGDPARGRFVFDHVSFGLEAEEQLWELADRLAEADMPVSTVVDHGFLRSIYAFDPNGIPLEFSVNVPGVDVRLRPVMADPRPAAAAAEGPDPVPGRWPAVEEPTPPEARTVVRGVGSDLFGGKAPGGS